MANGDRIVAAVVGRRRRRRGRTRRFRAPELDCLEEEGEESTAVLLPQLDLLWEVSIVGGDRRHLGQFAAMAPLGLGLLQQGEKEGEEEHVVEGGLLNLPGGARTRGSGGGGRGVARPWRQCFSCRHRDDADSGDPLSGFYHFSLFQKFQ